jgi:hypothetical protein
MLSIILACFIGLAIADQVIIIGDSWGTEGGPELEKVFTEHGATWKTANYAVGGTTTDSWAKSPDRMVNDINRNSDAEYVWLTLGGNDAADYLPSCTSKHPYPDLQCMNYIIWHMINNTIIMLDPVFKAHPHIQVVQFGYDILNFQKGICSAEGAQLIHGCNDDPTCLNTQYIKLQHQYVEHMATLYPGYKAINLLGSLQLEDKSIPDVTLGHPNLAYWSPANLIQANCIHATKTGFTDIFENMWDVYWSKL